MIWRVLLLTVLTVGTLVLVGRGPDKPWRHVSTCQIGWVYDGDTVELKCGTDHYAARVVGLDTPETKRPRCEAEYQAGKAATAALRQELKRGTATFDRLGTDKYGRPLIRLYVDKQDIAPVMIDRGLAVAYDGGKRPDWCARLTGEDFAPSLWVEITGGIGNLIRGLPWGG